MHKRFAPLLAVAVLLACDGGGARGVAGSATRSVAAAAAPAIATPADFLRRQPASTVVASADGTRLLHASGFSFDTGLARPEDAAAAYLAAHGGAFGVTDRHALALRGPPPADGVAAVRVQRAIDDLPVFGGDLVLGVTGGKVFLVNAADVPAEISGAHDLGAERAGALALAAYGGGEAGSDLVAVTPGWKPLPDVVRAVYRVDVVARDPEGSRRVFLDGESGAVLFAEDRRVRASAPGSAFEISPVETAAGLCPLSGAFHATCASPVAVTLDHLVGGASLTGTQTTVRNCRGGAAPASSPASACSAVTAISGKFQFPAETASTALGDDFSAVMAYYHLDRHVSFFKALDPALPGGTSLALNGSLPALVNVTLGGRSFDNAYYDPVVDVMVFGQGTSVDLAYDATVMYHELTHGVVEAWGGFAPNIDAMGGLDEPGAVNEGTADAMAASETGRSAIGAFLGPSLAGKAALRDMADPAAALTCKGSGRVVMQLGVSGVDGLDGEVHDDGEIWSGFYWELYDGLRTAGVKGCGGACEAGPAIQYKALQLAAGASPTFATYWSTMQAAASALFPSQPAVASYVDCVARRRGLDRCDRTVPLYAGETKLQFVRLRYSPFQIAVTADATGSARIGLCSSNGSTTTVWIRKSQPVQLSAIDPSSGNATIVADTHFSVSQACSGGTRTLALPATGAATWYLLFDAPATITSSPGYDIYRVTASATGVAGRPAASAPASCTPPSNGSTALTITPPSATVASGASATFTASGGSGTGYTWSLQANPSGGTITAAGVYTAGATSAVIDVVRVVDSGGAAATASVTVTPAQLPPPPALTITPISTTVAPGGSATFHALGGAGDGYVWSLQASPSGGRIGADGVYTAGAIGGVTDIVKVMDSHASAATAEVAVVAATPGGGSSGPVKGGGCASGGGPAGPLSLLAAAALLGRGRRRARHAPEARA